MENKYFAWQDYLVFAAMLTVSALIGLYHGFKSRKQQSSGEFLLGSGKLGTIPVALSMLASFLSSITLMGQPAEVYLFGSQIWLMGIATFLAIPFIAYIIVPFYHEMQLTSAYEYFGRRFHRSLQMMASIFFTVQMVLFLALVLYAPALAFHQVTGLNTELIVSVMYIVCIFYTTIGGMKAVIWTDTFQVLVLYGSMVAVLVKGTMDVGGFNVVWERNSATDRVVFFNWNPDPTERYTFWSALFGSAFLHAATYGANQLQVQRYLTVPTVQKARTAVWINAVGWTIVVLLTTYAGLLIYAKYYDCDPLSSHVVNKADQLFPLFVMDTLGDFPGLPGIFVSGIFSAGLSTVSTGVNSLAAIWFSELNGTKFKQGLSERGTSITVKLLALGFGLLSFALVFVVPYLGGLVPVAISLTSFLSGSLFGVLLLGIYVPWANTIGATTGLVTGVGLVGWMTVGVQVAVEAGESVFTVLPTSVDNCPHNFTLSPARPRVEAFALYQVSFLWYSLIAIVTTFFVGLAVSFVCKTKHPKPTLMTLSPLLMGSQVRKPQVMPRRSIL